MELRRGFGTHLRRVCKHAKKLSWYRANPNYCKFHPHENLHFKERKVESWVWWLIPIIPATWEMEIQKIEIQPRQKLERLHPN
jgi:hypothetical protein